MEWQTVIGLEVHTQLLTQSKLFSGTATTFGAKPNTQASEIDLGLPGVLPVLNTNVLTMAIKFGLAINGSIAIHSVFSRKHYFYPDLPKGYQISQYDQPIVANGYLDITLDESHQKRIPIRRAHLEEDAGKSVHEALNGKSGIDLNRAGIPLLEIVSEPELNSAKEAVAYLKSLHSLVRYLGICDGNMQEGSFRCDANVSVKPKNSRQLGTRTEIKNLNSFRFIERAINYEVARQIDLLEEDHPVIQETRLYDDKRDATYPMRSKEEAQDYRYFPDPDLLPIVITDSMIQSVRMTLPELPEQKKQRFCEQYQLTAYDAALLVSSRESADYFEKVVTGTEVSPKLAANWINGELTAALNKENKTIENSRIRAEELGKLLKRIEDHTLSQKMAKDVFAIMWEENLNCDEVISRHGFKQVSDPHAIENAVRTVIKQYPEQVASFAEGNEKVFGFFVGKVMQQMQGKADPKQVNEWLRKILSEKE